jgi:WhiB family redox-sensing transcriptional regulator
VLHAHTAIGSRLHLVTTILQPSQPRPKDSAPGALSDKPDTEAQGPRIHKDSGPFFFIWNIWKRLSSNKTKIKQGKAQVRTMTVLFSELLVPGWAEGDDAMIGLDAVTGVYGTDRAFTLPCHNSNPEIFFSEKSEEIAYAKSLCGGCPVKKECLEGALSRQEPCGVWGYSKMELLSRRSVYQDVRA